MRDRPNHASELVRQAEIDRLDQDLSRLDWEIRESNITSYFLQGLNYFLSGTYKQNHCLNKFDPERLQKALESWDCHSHDFTQLSVYCVRWDFADLLRERFCEVQGILEAEPLQDFRVAFRCRSSAFLYATRRNRPGSRIFKFR
jgi:ribonucleoside-triphosphate reductase